MASVALRGDRVLFSSSGSFDAADEFDGEHANVLCSLIASSAAFTLTGSAGAGTARLTGLAAPTAAGDAISAGYTSWKAPVRAVATGSLADVTYGADTITGPADGVGPGRGPLTCEGVQLVQGDRVLVSGQTGADADRNGIYTVTVTGTNGTVSYELTRAFDFVDGTTIAGAAVVVQEGAQSAGSIFCVTSSGTVGTDNIVFAEVGGGGGAPVTLEPNSVTLEKLVHGESAGQLLYYTDAGAAGAEPPFPPALLNLGTEGYPLVAGATVPGYALLTGAGLADEIYKENLILGNDAAGETIRFGTNDDDVVGIYVDNGLKLSATATGGTFSGTWSGSSDEKWKDLLGPISADPLGDLDKVESQTWTWKPGYHFGDAGAFGAGIVAQQFQLVCPRAVTFSAEQDGLIVDYNALHSFNLACVKALKQENAARQAEIAALAGANSALAETNAALAARTEALETRLAALEAAFAAHGHS